MKGKKLIFAFILALIVCVALIPLCAYAEEGAEEPAPTFDVEPAATPSEGTETPQPPETIQDAVDQIGDTKDKDTGKVSDGVGGTITVEGGNVNEESELIVGYLPDDNSEPVGASSCNITIDLGGNELNAGKSGRVITIYSGNVTIANGTVNGDIRVYLSSTLTINEDVTVNGYILVYGKATASTTKNYYRADDTTPKGKEYNGTAPVANIYGTVQNTEDSALYTNGTDRSGATINIYSTATISSEKDVGIYLPSGNLNVYGGTITGTTGIYSKGGSLNIMGGTITGTLDPSGLPDLTYNNGCSSTGTAITIEHSEINVDGKTDAGYPLLTPSQVSISGGKLISNATKAVLVYTRHESQTPATGFITGGIFSSDPTVIYDIANGKDASYVKKGVEVKLIDGLWYVGSSIPVPEEIVVEQVPVVTTAVEAVVEGNSTVSLAANEEVVIKLNFTANDKSGETVEVTAVIINGVEVEFTIAADGSIVLSPEVLAALGPGTHTIYIRTSEGLVKVTITITE